MPSHVTELPDGSWLIVGSWYPGGQAKAWTGAEGEQLEFYRSTDRGRTWQFWSYLQCYPPHSISEASMLVLDDGRLMLYCREARGEAFPARESRGGAFPALKAFSEDNGKIWRTEEVPFGISGRTAAGFLPDGRVMVTFRSAIGRNGLWAFIGDPLDHTQFSANGAHFNDRYSVGLKQGALHLDSDGICGQFTQYILRPPDSADTAIDITVEVKVVANNGGAATLSVPYVGKFRLYPDRIELAHDPSVRVEVRPGEFHTYRVVRQLDGAWLYVDGELACTIEKPDANTIPCAWTPTKPSVYALAFGNESRDDTYPISTNRGAPAQGLAATGYSVWRRFESVLDDPKAGRHTATWSAARDGFPDQYQLDHIIEVEATATSGDQGYSGWKILPDGRIFVVNYTDDTAPIGGGWIGIPWIRGTFLLSTDLPPVGH